MAIIERELRELGRRAEAGPKRPTVQKPTVSTLIAESVANFGRDTALAFTQAHNDGLKHPGQLWKCGHPLLDRTIRSLKSGMILMGGVENCGKSNFANVLAIGILDNTENSIVVDVILDDDRETRLHQLAAARGHLPMDLMTVPALIPKGDSRLEQRREAYASLSKEYQDRLEIIDSSSWGDKGAYLENLELYFRALRAEYPHKKIWVTLDAFDDVKTPSSVRREERVEHISAWIKTLCNELGALSPFVIFAIKHLNKNNRNRWTSGDAFGGSGHLLYDAKVSLLAYSEMGEMGNAASIYFHPDPKDLTKKNPILEVYIQKTKRGEGKGRRLYYQQWPAEYFCAECNDKDQETYDLMVMDSVGSKKDYKR